MPQPEDKIKDWLTANWRFIRQLKLAFMSGFAAWLIFSEVADVIDLGTLIDLGTTPSLQGIAIEIGVILGLYGDPDEWYLP